MAITLSGSTGVTYPAGGLDNVAGAGVGTTDTQTLTNKTLTSPAVNSPTIGGTPVMGASVITSGTAVASTSGTSIDFTSIPSWVKRITVMFNGVSGNGSSNLLVQLGTGSTTYTTSGYNSSTTAAAGSVTTGSSTAGFIIWQDTASFTMSGQLILTNITGNTWVGGGTVKLSTTVTAFTGGDVALGAALTAVRITRVNGTDTFDAGSINILYE